jgi:hypothetical protein
MLTILLVAYFLIGLVVYAVTDTTGFARKVERQFFFLTYSDISKLVFPSVVVLWPLWLVINARYND